MMYNVSYRIVQSREDAEDIVQESLVKGFQKIHQIKEELSLGAWLKRIVVNASLDCVRKKKKESWIEETRVLETDTVEREIEDDSQVTVALIKQCLSELKEKYRIILTLEISEMLNIKESTVRNQYRRGKNRLIDKLQKKNKNGFKKLHTGS